MSHFTRVKTRMHNVVAIEEALKDLNHRISPVNVINGWQGTSRKADMVAKTAGPYDIGFVKAADGTYDLVADWWGIRTTTGIKQETFVNQLTQRYSYRLVISEMVNHNYQNIVSEVMPDQSVRVTASKW